MINKKILILISSIILFISLARSDLYQDIGSGWREIYDVYKKINTN